MNICFIVDSKKVDDAQKILEERGVYCESNGNMIRTDMKVETYNTRCEKLMDIVSYIRSNGISCTCKFMTLSSLC